MGRKKIMPLLKGTPMFPSEYIIAEDLHGKDVHLTISRVRIEDRPTDTGPQPMPMLYFEEMDRKKSDKRLGLNKTNARAIASLHGPEATKWVGCRITLFPTTCDAFGETVTCVRIRSQAPPNGRGASRQEPPPADEGGGAADGELSAEEEAAAFGDGAS